jgi:hypothetical protein
MGLAYHGKNATASIGNLMLSGVEFTVEFSRDYIDASTYGDSAKFFFAGLPQTNGSFSGFYVGGLSVAQSGLVSITFTTPSGSVSGQAYVDASMSASVNDAIRVSGRFKGVGSWSES